MSEKQTFKYPGQDKQQDSVNILDILHICLAEWRWFVLSVIVLLGIAFVYLLRTPSTYVMSAEVLIKENNRTQSIGGDVASMFANLGVSPGRTNVVNELRAMMSPATLLEVGKRLSLDVNYQTDGLFHKQTLYGSRLPVKVSFVDLADGESARMTVRLLVDGSFELSKLTRRKEKFSETIVGRMNDTIYTPLGRVLIQPTPRYGKYMSEEPQDIYILRTDLYIMTDIIRSRLAIASDNKDLGTVIDLSYSDIIPQRAEDILNTLLSVYKENWMLDRNQLTIATSRFINDRLDVIERELSVVDADIASYKSQNMLPDIEAASRMYMEQSQDATNQILMLNTQLSMTRYIHDYLLNNTTKNELLPVNSGIESVDIKSHITAYNDLQLQRNSLVSNSSEKNPLVVDMDQSLAAIRSSIISSVENLEISLKTQIADLQKNDNKIIEQIAANPDQAKYLLTVGRQQKIKEALYLFLLQKREENELSRTFTAHNMRVLTPPMGNMRPVSPKKQQILILALIMGMLIPIIVIFIRETINTTIRGRKDIEGLTVPFIGEIPLHISTSKKKKKELFGKKQEEKRVIVVKEGSRNVVNEAFRVVRTNLEFMLGQHTSSVIAITSFNPGSGKSFVAMNIGATMAIKGNDVLVIDGDMRHASASSYVDSPRKGLSDYLTGRVTNLSEIIVHDPQYNHLDVLPVGVIPPNPTELLLGERFKQLIETVRGMYHCVIIDSPPIEIVADAQIIETQVDRTIFVLRSGLFEKSLLSELERLYAENKYKNMSVILNGTGGTTNRYGYQRYGYSYGYGYGYGYYNKGNESYNYGETENKGKKKK
jgi:capsular exopolysaccharide synthesis family protein